MNKKKFLVLALLMIAVIALTSCMLVACNTDEETPSGTTETIEATKDLLISNGDFKVVGSTTSYPSSITSWTGGKMYSSGNYNDDVISGAISLDKTAYDQNKSKWDDDDDTLYNLLTANGRYDNDDIKNAMMVYMPTASTDDDGDKIYGPTAYGYTSSTFTLARGSYYKLTVDVLTHNIGGSNEEDRGARIYVSSNTYAEFDGIDTNGQWKTYTIIIESSPSSSTTLSVMLGLGKYSASYTTGLTTGYAVFDNLSLVKIDEKGKTMYDDAVAKELNKDDNITTATLKVSNGRFDFGTTTISSSGTPNGWSLVKGNSGESDSAPTSLGYNGIIDVAKFGDNYKKYSSTYYVYDGASTTTKSYVPADALVNIQDTISTLGDKTVGSNVFMLSQQLMTAQGIKSSRSITIEKNKTYEISVNLYTYAVHGAGVSLVLTGSDGKDITIKGISTKPSDSALIGNTIIDDTCHDQGTDNGASTNGWQKYTFYIQGNQYKDYSYTMAIWLGTEGTNSNTAFSYTNTNGNNQTTYTANGTFSTGWVFIDELNLQEISSLPSPDESILGANTDQTLDIAEAGMSAYTALCVDLTTTNIFSALVGSDATTNSAVEKIGTGAPTGWTSNYDTTDKSNPVISNFISEGVVNVADEASFNGTGTYPELPYDIENKVAYQLHASNDSYYEVQTPSFAIEKNGYYRVSLWVKTIDVKSTSGAYVYLIDTDDEDATLTSFTQINTNDKDGFDEYLNDWCELTIYIRGNQKDVSNVALKLTLGTGNRWASETLTSGSVFVTNINGSVIDYSTYKGATTGTYTKSVNLADSNATYTFTNGSFDEYDESDDNLEESKPLNEQTVAGTPSSWTFSDKTLKPNTADSSLIAGIIALNSNDNGKSFEGTTQSNAVLPGIIGTDFYPSFESLSGELYNVLPGKKGQLLAIGSKDSEAYAAGYTSQSLSLSANGFYKLSVWVKTVNSATASIYLTGESAVAEGTNSTFVVTSTASDYADWTNYVYYLATGNNSVSVKLNLWLGQNKDYVAIDEHVTEDSLKSAGVAFFDNVVYQTIDEDDFDSATEGNTVKKLSFTVDSFDSLSSTTSSRDSLSSPSGWTGTVGSASGTKSSYTKGGVIYIDGNFLTSDRELEVDGNKVNYIDILGKDYDVDSDDDELKLTDSEIAGKSDDEILALKQAKADALKKANWITLSELLSKSGHQALVINNTRENQYTYTSSSMTLKEDSFYKVSVWVRTLKIAGKTDNDEHIGANVELYLGSANESDNPFIFKAIKTEGEWTQYSFYIQTLDEDVTSVTVKLSLGNAVEDEDDDDILYGLTRGYAFFDDVAVEKVDEETFESATDSDLVLKRTVSNETSGKSDEDDEKDETPTSSGFNTEYLWWMVPTIVLGLLIIIVLIVYLVRKVKKPVAKKVEKKVATIKETPSLDTKHDKYDENKE